MNDFTAIAKKIEQFGAIVPKFYKRPTQRRLKKMQRLFQEIEKAPKVLQVFKTRMQKQLERCEDFFNHSKSRNQ